MVNLVEMFLDFTIISAFVCCGSFVLSKIDGRRSARHRERGRRFLVIGIVCGMLGGVGELWLNLR